MMTIPAVSASVANVIPVATLRGSACDTAYTTGKHALIGVRRSAATPEQLATPICRLLGRESDNLCGALLAADGGWSVV